MIKYCYMCNQDKDISEYYLSNSAIYRKECKSCTDEIVLKRKRTKKGLVSRIFTDQKQTCKKRGHEQPKYTLDELLEWVFKQNSFHTLYENWVTSGYKTLLRPSIDRKDDYKSYSFKNIQLITFKENVEKVGFDTLDGKNNKRNKAVIQLDKNWIKIKEFYSISKASRELQVCGSNISSACTGRIPSAYGYKWKFKNEDIK